jgi:hypothetical protein
LHASITTISTIIAILIIIKYNKKRDMRGIGIEETGGETEGAASRWLGAVFPGSAPTN